MSSNSKKSYYYNQHSGDGSWSDILGDVYSGIAVGSSHSKWFVSKTIDWGWKSIVGEDAVEQEDGASDAGSKNQGLKVVGVGYGRTGTYSLALALDELGFPALHTQHLYEHAEIFDMLVKNIFHKSIQQDEVIMGNPDFSLLTEKGFTATVDLPFALYYDQILEQYPDCKFILTVRENSEVWFKSWDIMTRSITQPAQYAAGLFTHVRKLDYYMRWLFSVVNADKKYLSHPFPLPPQIKSNAISSYEKHNQQVRDSIPPSQLLEYNVRQGWEPLCQFLEISENECPSTHGIPFPKSNSARAVQIQSFSAFLGPLILVTFIIFSLFSLLFRKFTGVSVIEWCFIQKTKFLQRVGTILDARRKRM